MKQDLKLRLKAGDILAGTMCLIPSAVSAQAIASAGADFIIIDQEHGPVGPEALHAMIAATAGTDCAPLVRVPRADEVWVKTALDAGAEGINFPMVNSAADAAYCVSLLTYPPRGKRGWGPFVAHARWNVPLFGYLPHRGDKTVSMLTIETAAAVSNIRDICKVEGVDCLVIGAFDLTTDLGVSGDFNAPTFKDAVREVEAAAAEAGLPLGGAAMTEQHTGDLLVRGYRVLLHGFDVLMLAQRVREASGWRKSFPG
jgi:4-hydroxy-2-oxoheptanedioate aldolase